MITIEKKRRGTPKGSKKKGKGPIRDENGRFISPINGQPVPDSPAARATRFKAGDPRAKEAQKLSIKAQKEKGDLKRLCQMFMENIYETDKDGNPVTGGQLMVNEAIKGVKNGNPRFWELLRDTAGFKPVDKVMVAEVDPAVVDEVEAMIQETAEEDGTE